MAGATPPNPGISRRHGARYWLSRLLFTLLAVIALALATGIGLLYATLPPRHQKIELTGLSAPVEISFDANGIPFIRAQNPRDAAQALGYVHAQSRMFQMDMMRRAASGRLAELFGPIALGNDEEMRRLGLSESAASDAAGLSPDARAMLAAYADGVNAWIAQRGRLAAPEFLFLGRPQPWRITDSLLWGKLMGLWLSGNWDTEVARLELGNSHPRDKIDGLWPAIPGMLPETAQLQPAAIDSPSLAGAGAKILAWIRVFPEPFTQPAQASNEFAVSGARTRSGKPLLAGDPHLGFGFPSLWYLVRIDLPGAMLAGATAPGAPFLIIGHNAKTAWTFTSTGADVQDVFIEHQAGRGAYATPEGPKPFLNRIERIRVAGHPDVVLDVLITRHGPVIGTAPDGALLAVEMGNLAPGDTDADGLLQLDRAQSLADVQKAATEITSPVQNLLAADAGHIGFFTTGRVPIRKSGDGAWPVDGADGLHDWTGFAGGSALPYSIDPPSGELINSNNPTWAPGFPVFMGRDVYGDWRARRIRSLLAAPGQTPASFAAIQLDVTSAFAQAILPQMLALDLPPHDAAMPALALLTGWNGNMAMDAPQPLIFNAWTREMAAGTLQRNGFDPDEAPVLDDSFLYALLGPGGTAAAQAMWCGGAALGGDCRPLLRSSLDAAFAKLQLRYGKDPKTWRWGLAHQAVFAHPILGSLPVIGHFARFTIAVPGDASTIDVAAPSPTDADPNGFTAVHGPELRAIFDLSDLDRSLFIIAPGQSGNLLSLHAGDLLRPWRSGRYIMLGSAPFPASRTVTLSPSAQSH